VFVSHQIPPSGTSSNYITTLGYSKLNIYKLLEVLIGVRSHRLPLRYQKSAVNLTEKISFYIGYIILLQSLSIE
jgi:hypothetical protein